MRTRRLGGLGSINRRRRTPIPHPAPAATRSMHSPSFGSSSFAIPRRRILILALSLVASILAIGVASSNAPAQAADACTGPGCDSVVMVDGRARFTMYSDAVPGSGVQRMYFGNPGDEPLMGDWNCDGEDTPGVYRRSSGLIYLRNSNTPGNADAQYFFGNAGDIALAGDFNGNGCDTVSIYRPSEQRFYITNSIGGGAADYTFYFGNPGDTPLVGDFDGDGRDTVALHRVSTGRVYLTNDMEGGEADADFIFGNPGDIVFAGDWNGNGRDSVAAHRPSNGMVYMRFSNRSGPADAEFFTGGYAHAMPASGLPTFTGVVTNFKIDVDIYPGQNIDDVAWSHPEGTVFRINGVHYGQSVEPRNGQVFVGGAGALMDGQGWVDHAFRSNARDVHIQGIEVTNYGSPEQHGAIEARGDGWVIIGNEVSYNDAVGIRVYDADRAIVMDNNVHHNDQTGFGASFTTDSLFENNVIAYNNYNNTFNWGFEAGGTKFWSTTNLVVRGNHSHHNRGPGLWTDHDNVGTVYEGNLVEDNYAAGIFHEISYNATIRNNTLRRNGFGHDAWLWGGGITLASSSGVKIYGNRLEDNHNGITMTQQNRGGGDLGAWKTRNNVVTNNTIIDSGISGAAEDIGDDTIFYDGNDFQGNTYIGDSGWEWNGGNVGWSTWRSYGLDRNGSYR